MNEAVYSHNGRGVVPVHWILFVVSDVAIVHQTDGRQRNEGPLRRASDWLIMQGLGSKKGTYVTDSLLNLQR